MESERVVTCKHCGEGGVVVELGMRLGGKYPTLTLPYFYRYICLNLMTISYLDK